MSRPDQPDRSAPLAAAVEAANRAEAGADLAVRDRLIALALAEGDSAAEIAEALGMTRQAVYTARDRLTGVRAGGSASAETAVALESFSDPAAFERLVWVLLHDVDPALRPLGGTGDRGRDAAGGPGADDTTIVSISLSRDWARKVRRDLERILTHGHHPERVFAVTNRRITRKAEQKLETAAATRGITLRILDQRWLVAKLTHPAYLHLRQEYLGLAPPRTPVFLPAHEFAADLPRHAALGQQTPLVGRAKMLARARQVLDTHGWLVFEGAGGMGKTRLALELAYTTPDSEDWWFLDDATPFDLTALSELGSGREAVVVLDNAHRRGDLRGVLSALSRRAPRPRVILTIRSGRAETLADAATSSWLAGPVSEVALTVGALPRSDIATLLRNPPFEIRYEGMVRSLVFLSEGNPQLAILAGSLAREGKSLPDISRDELLRRHVSILVTSATAGSSDSRQLREVLAIVAALGELNGDDTGLLEKASQLTGFPLPAIRRWLNDLCDAGLLMERNGLYRIKPDLLSEHVLMASFFARDWRPLLPYGDVVDVLAPRHLHRLVKALGGLPYGAVDANEPRLEKLRRLLTTAVEQSPLESAAPLVRDLAPGIEDLAVTLLSRLVKRLELKPDQLSTSLVEVLTDATQRLPGSFAESWRVLLRLAGIAGPRESLRKVADAMAATYKRIPVDISADDGRILAGIQVAMVEETSRYAIEAAQLEGTKYALAAASRALLTAVVQSTEPAADRPLKYHFRAGTLPASPYTRRAFETGAHLWAKTFLALEPPEQVQQIEAALAFARSAAGFAGPIGVKLDEQARVMASDALAVIDRYLVEHFQMLSTPVRAEALRYLMMRAEFEPPAGDSGRERTPGISPPLPDEQLDEYLQLFHPYDVERPRKGEGWQAERERRVARASILASRLASRDDWCDRLGRWAELQTEAEQLFDRISHGAVLSTVLHQLATTNPTRGVEVVDKLVRSRSPLRSQASAAMNALIMSEAVGLTELERWLDADAITRSALASGLGGVSTEVGRSTLMRLSEDPDPAVRTAILDSLRFGSQLEEWRFELGLRLAGQAADIEALHTVLLALDVSAESNEQEVRLTPAQLTAARLALLATARVKRTEAHALEGVLSQLERHGAECTMEWVWARVDWLDNVDSSVWDLDLMPDELAQRVGDKASQTDFDRGLQLLRSASTPTEGVEAVTTILGWIDPTSPRITEEMLRWWNTDEQWKADRLLRLPLTWDGRAVQAKALVAALGDQAPVEDIVLEMLPMMWSGSRVPDLEAALERVEAWRASGDPTLVHAGTRGVAMLKRMIAAERERDRAELEWEEYA